MFFIPVYLPEIDDEELGMLLPIVRIGLRRTRCHACIHFELFPDRTVDNLHERERIRRAHHRFIIPLHEGLPLRQGHGHILGFAARHTPLIATFSTFTIRRSGGNPVVRTSSGLCDVPRSISVTLYVSGQDNRETISHAFFIEIVLYLRQRSSESYARVSGRMIFPVRVSSGVREDVRFLIILFIASDNCFSVRAVSG